MSRARAASRMLVAFGAQKEKTIRILSSGERETLCALPGPECRARIRRALILLEAADGKP